MIDSTSVLKWFFVGALLYGFCAPDPLDDLNINLNIKENKQKGIGQAGRSETRDKQKPVHSPTKDGIVWILGKHEHCFHECGSKGGPCPEVCGENGWCCRKDFTEDNCPDRAREVATSGYHSCVKKSELSCPTRQLNTGDRRDEKVFKQIDSAWYCSKLCQTMTNCNFWSWANRFAGSWALDCVLMSGYGFTYADSHVVSGTKRCDPIVLSCPALHTNTKDRRQEEVLKNIGSQWQCARKCRQKTTCNFWSWANEDAGHYALDCVLMSGFGYKINDTNVISGRRNCSLQEELSCPTRQLNTGDRRDEKVLKHIGTAWHCSKLCRQKTNCNFWSWANRFAGSWALDCVLMSGYGFTYADSHVVSGAKKCDPIELSCPALHTNTKDRRNEVVFKHIRYHSTCARMCRQKTTCNFWSWANEDAGHYALDCVLMSHFGYKVNDTNVISGRRNCPGEDYEEDVVDITDAPEPEPETSTVGYWGLYETIQGQEEDDYKTVTHLVPTGRVNDFLLRG